MDGSKMLVFGSYYATDSVLHRMDPRIKLTVAVIYMIVAIIAVDLRGIAALAVFTAIAIALANIPAREVANSIKPLLFIMVFTALINVLATNQGTVYWQWGPFVISSGGLWNALIFTLRVGLMLFGASLLTLTTSPIDLADGLEHVLRPLSRLGVPVTELAMMVSIAFRFLPTFLEEFFKIKAAQESRGLAFDQGGPIERAKLFLPLMAPLFASAFRHAEKLAQAMDSRCYRGGHGRTRMHEMKIERRDILALLAAAVLVAVLIVLRFI